MPTLATLTSGSLGALVGVLGAFLLAWITIRRDRREQRRTADGEARRRVAVSAARVLDSVLTETRFYPMFIGRAQKAYLDLITTANTESGHCHPDVVKWILQRHRDIDVSAQWQWRSIWRLAAKNRNSTYIANEVSQIAGHLSDWANGTRDDTWFADDLRDRTEDSAAS